MKNSHERNRDDDLKIEETPRLGYKRWKKTEETNLDMKRVLYNNIRILYYNIYYIFIIS